MQGAAFVWIPATLSGVLPSNQWDICLLGRVILALNIPEIHFGNYCLLWDPR